MVRSALFAAMLTLAGLYGPPAVDAATTQTKSSADPVYDAAKAANDALGVAAIADIQRDLLLTGDLNALASGEYGKRSFAAIRAFQKRIGARETGLLDEDQRKSLRAEAGRVTAELGFKSITENGVTVLLPSKLATERSEGRRGPKYAAKDDSVTVDILAYPPEVEAFNALFERLKKPREGRTISYSLLKPEFFVISGTTEGKNFYMRFLATPTGAKGFVVGWNPSLSPGFDRVPVVMASSLTAVDQIAPVVPTLGGEMPPDEPAKPKGPPVPFEDDVAYLPRDGVGIVISAEGDIVTTATLVAGCEQLAVADGGIATVIAGDRVNNLALARLTKPGAAHLALARGTVSAAAPLIVLGGEQGTQTGQASITSDVGPGGDTRRFMAATADAVFFLDGNGALISPRTADGPNGEAVGLKPSLVSAFLRSHGVSSGAAAGERAGAVVRLHCDAAQR